MVYLDNAATSGKKPSGVINSVVVALKNYCANPGRSGHNLSVETAARIYNTRQNIADFFGCEDAENVAFTQNCTHALNCVIKGLISVGEHVVVSSLEHNAVMRPLYAVGADISVAGVSLTDDGQTVENFKKALKPQTKMVICTGASNVLGKKLPVSAIAKVCRERNIPFAVDGAQIAGTTPINMEKDGIDFLCLAPHKGLYAPTGTGVLIARKPLGKTLIQGGTGSDSVNPVHPITMPEAVESGTVNVAGIFGIGAGLDFVKRRGIKNIARYEDFLCKRIYYGLRQNRNVVLYADYNKLDFSPVISFNFKDYGSEQTASLLNNKNIAVRAGLHCAPSAHRQIDTLTRGTVRVSPSVFNTQSEIDYFLSTLSKI